MFVIPVQIKQVFEARRGYHKSRNGGIRLPPSYNFIFNTWHVNHTTSQADSHTAVALELCPGGGMFAAFLT